MQYLPLIVIAFLVIEHAANIALSKKKFIINLAFVISGVMVIALFLLIELVAGKDSILVILFLFAVIILLACMILEFRGFIKTSVKNIKDGFASPQDDDEYEDDEDEYEDDEDEFEDDEDEFEEDDEDELEYEEDEEI